MNLRKLTTARKKLLDSVQAFEKERFKYQAVLESDRIEFSEDIAQSRIARCKAQDLTLDTETAVDEEARQAELRQRAFIQREAICDSEKAIKSIDANLLIFKEQIDYLDAEIDALVSNQASALFSEKRDLFFRQITSAVDTLIEAGALYKLSRQGYTPSCDAVVIPRMESTFLAGFQSHSNQTFRLSGDEIKSRINNRSYSIAQEIMNG